MTHHQQNCIRGDPEHIFVIISCESHSAMRWSLCLITELLVKCQPCFDGRPTCSLLTAHGAASCLLTAAHSPRVPPRCQGAAGDGCQYRQLANRRSRLGAQIVMTTRREDMHYTRSALLRMCLLQFVTCCALPFTRP